MSEKKEGTFAAASVRVEGIAFDSYIAPEIVTYTGAQILEQIGPAQAGTFGGSGMSPSSRLEDRRRQRKQY